MSLAAERPVRFRLGTRIAALGSLLVLVSWLASARAFEGQQRAELARQPEREIQGRRELLLSALRERLAREPRAVDHALAAARRRAEELAGLRESRRGRRVVEAPDLRELAGEELEPAAGELGVLDLAWLRLPGGAVVWDTGGHPEQRDAPWRGACLLRLPGERVALGACLERELDAETLVPGATGGRFVAGGARLVSLSDQPGAWRLSRADSGAALQVGPGWPGGEDSPSPAAPGPRSEERTFDRQRWRVETWPLGDPPLLLETAAPLPRPRTLAELLQGEAGPARVAWEGFLAWSGGLALVLLLALWALAWRINAAFRPVVAAARQLGADRLDVAVPVRRSDEIGALAAVLSDLSVSLQAARRGWESQARLAAWRDVARGLAHEIKNPLTPIQGTVENLRRWWLEDRPRFEERFDSRMATILEEVAQLSRLAGSFSDFARLPPPAKEPLLLAELLEGAAELQLVDRPGLRVELSLAEGLETIAGDPGQLRQVLTNLLKNAREALGGEGGLIRLACGAASGAQWFSVEDDGPGVEAEHLKKLCVPGWSTRKDEGGSGLGLWLCHRIVLEHGGSIEASRSELGGLCVRVVLPAR